MLEADPLLHVTAEASNLTEVLEQHHASLPDVLLLNLRSRPHDDLSPLRSAHAQLPRLNTLLLGDAQDARVAQEALRSGARGLVDAEATASELATALRSVHEGGYWMGRRRVSHPAEAMTLLQREVTAERGIYGLTARELSVVECIVDGCSNKDIAHQFSITEDTVKRHLSNTFDKTGVSTRLELALFALTHRLVAPLHYAT